MDNSHFIKQAEEIISGVKQISSRAKYSDMSDLSEDETSRLISKSKAFVARTVGTNSEYYKDIISILDQKTYYPGTQLKFIVGTVIALKEDLENDYLKSYSEILNSNIFNDYIEIAEHLLENGYKDSAAVIIGSTLETELRKLCEKNNIEIEIIGRNGKSSFKKADSMNSDLVKESVYSKINQKQVTSWLGIRNSAAHGKYSEYTEQDVKLMLDGIKNFIVNNPA